MGCPIVTSIHLLICTQVFYEYLNTILQRRAEFSPHLNPPLQTTYQYARHHILWNKPELFFEDWEVRYGLWKCFRSKRHITEVKPASHDFSASHQSLPVHTEHEETESQMVSLGGDQKTSRTDVLYRDIHRDVHRHGGYNNNDKRNFIEKHLHKHKDKDGDTHSNASDGKDMSLDQKLLI